MQELGHDSVVRKAVDNAAIRAFFEGWQVYLSIIEHDYMDHSRIVDHVLAELQRLATPKPRVLELGCGDVYIMRQVSARWPLAAYTGVDLSDMALEMARNGLATAPEMGETLLICGDMLGELRALDTPHSLDLILAGYSLHHLQQDKKAEAFAAMRRLLRPGGTVLIYDLLLPDDQDRLPWLEWVCDRFVDDWTALSEPQHASIRTHVTERDFPETAADHDRLALAAGLRLRDRVQLDTHGIFHLMAYDG